MENSTIRSRKISKIIDTSILAIAMIGVCYVGAFKRIVVNHKKSK